MRAFAPELDGELADDESSLTAAATDFGRIAHRRPRAVLRPASTDDVVAIVRVANARRLRVAARGRGHCCYGQAQAEAGILIDMSTLASIRRIDTDRVTVDAGATWGAVLDTTLPYGLTPPVFTDYLGASVGGTLSVGGIGGTSYRHGLQVDNVLELAVITGNGASHTCSRRRNEDLFHAVRAGLGQCGVIVGATLRLVPAPARVRRYRLYYDTVTAVTAAQLALIDDGRFDFVQGQIRPNEDRWHYLLDVAKYYTPPAGPDDHALLGDLSYQRGTEKIEDLSYSGFQKRLDKAETYLCSTGEWFHPHPWWNGFFPSSTADVFLNELAEQLTTEDIGAAGLVLFYPIFTNRLGAPLFRTPIEPVVFLVGIMPFPPDDPGVVPRQIDANLARYRRALTLGATTYPIGAIPFTHDDWRHHFGTFWPTFTAAKNRYDPHHLLTPGPGIF